MEPGDGLQDLERDDDSPRPTTSGVSGKELNRRPARSIGSNSLHGGEEVTAMHRIVARTNAVSYWRPLSKSETLEQIYIQFCTIDY